MVISDLLVESTCSQHTLYAELLPRCSPDVLLQAFTPFLPYCLPSDLGLKQWQLQSGDAVAAVNRLYELVQQHQQVLESREHAEDELHKAKVEYAQSVSSCRSNSSSCAGPSDHTLHPCWQASQVPNLPCSSGCRIALCLLLCVWCCCFQ